MPFTLIGYSESQDSATLTNIAALADPHVRVSGDDIVVPKGLPNLLGCYFLGVSLTQGQLASPSLRRRVNLDVEPLDRNTLPLATTKPMHDFFDSPIPLDGEESLNALMAEDGTTTRGNALVWLGDGPVSPVKGDILTVRVTNASTLTANAWTNGALTFSQSLPAGTYQLVGARMQSTNLQGFRFVFVGQQWRPGAIGVNADADSDLSRFRAGHAGVWGEFSHNTPPTVDFLSNGADSSQVGHLDLMKTG